LLLRVLAQFVAYAVKLSLLNKNRETFADRVEKLRFSEHFGDRTITKECGTLDGQCWAHLTMPFLSEPLERTVVLLR
jgi:hypothetical protein